MIAVECEIAFIILTPRLVTIHLGQYCAMRRTAILQYLVCYVMRFEGLHCLSILTLYSANI